MRLTIQKEIPNTCIWIYRGIGLLLSGDEYPRSQQINIYDTKGIGWVMLKLNQTGIDSRMNGDEYPRSQQINIYDTGYACATRVNSNV
jgi:hypothetical protein